MNVLDSLRTMGRGFPLKAPPIPVVMDGLGVVGHLENRRGLYLNSAIEHHVRTLVREDEEAELAARDVSGGRFGASDLLPIIAKGSDTRDAIRAIKSMRATIDSFDDIIYARASGKYWDFVGVKVTPSGLVLNAWHSLILVAGNPAAATYSNIPGPPAKDASSTGAIPIPITLGTNDDLYLSNFGLNYQIGTSIALAVDLLTANANILANITTSQNINSTALPRWTGGAGVMMTLEVITALNGAVGIPNVRVNYTDQDGNSGSDTGNISLGLTSGAVTRLLPLRNAPIIKLASGDYGVRSIQQLTLSIGGAATTLALLQYKPLVAIPTLSLTTFVERSMPASIGGILKLTSVPGGSLPFIGLFASTSNTSVVPVNLLAEFVYG